jgi:mRNA interferase MazF
MGHYAAGDVVLAPFRFGEEGIGKVRPVVVIAVGTGGTLIVCPVSRSRPSEMAFVPVSLGDFARGGLDILDESCVLTGSPGQISTSDIIGLKGRLKARTTAEILAVVPRMR